MQNEIMFSQIPVNELKQFIQESIKEEMLKNSNKQPQPLTELITRNETCQILGISLPTLNTWTKKGLIQGYRISTRVRYKKSEILESVEKINSLKYRKGQI